MRKWILAALLGGAAMMVHATEDDTVYRHTDQQGVVIYSDKPLTQSSKPVNLPKLQTFSSNKPLKDFKFSEPAAAAPQFSIAFDSPTPNQNYHVPNAAVDVSVSVMPGLIGGYGLMYTVDGKPLNDAPSFSTSVSIPSLERGSHTIGVSLVDATRKPQASASVTVHMKPPTVKRN